VPERREHIRVPALGRYLHPVGEDFVAVEIASAIVLLAATAFALVLANSAWSGGYRDFWGHDLTIGAGRVMLSLDLRHWVNDGLMTIFFFVVGLEVKRELVEGALRDRRTATLPVLAALGGMVVPALVYTAFNPGGTGSRGWGVPMATDLAFALGVLTLAAPRAPTGLKLFLVTLAIVDDTGSVVVITIFYSGISHAIWMVGAAMALAVVIAMRRARVPSALAYVVPAFALWACTLAAGLGAAIFGALLGLLTPASPVRGRRVLHALEARLHLWASLAVVPLFALANAGIALAPDAIRAATGSAVTWGVVAGRVVGKPVGILAVVLVARRLGLGRLPAGVGARALVGVAALSGIGFTVALFIADLSFAGTRLAQAKVGILAASVVSGIVGAVLLARAARGSEPACE
jgi:NhaA family Na+:H+ antiporter